MKKVCNTKNMTRQEWLEARKAGLGGSDISAVMGYNRWRGPAEVYLDKTSPVDPEDALSDVETVYWGNVLEDVVAEEFSKRTGLKVRRCNYILAHDDYPFLTANVDRVIVGQSVGLECKTASQYKLSEWEGEEIPVEYIFVRHVQ